MFELFIKLQFQTSPDYCLCVGLKVAAFLWKSSVSRGLTRFVAAVTTVSSRLFLNMSDATVLSSCEKPAPQAHIDSKQDGSP